MQCFPVKVILHILMLLFCLYIISPKKEIIICKVRNQWRLSVKNKLDSLFFARLFVSEQKQIASMTRHKKHDRREFEILVASSQQVAQK